ncbi:MAG TPA: alpha-2-macroglobulin family protein, partial [Acidobacteriota bacterium]|nr:alpha-2-macroglobulin family protein [Acidobacteriota bacterium]
MKHSFWAVWSFILLFGCGLGIALIHPGTACSQISQQSGQPTRGLRFRLHSESAPPVSAITSRAKSPAIWLDATTSTNLLRQVPNLLQPPSLNLPRFRFPDKIMIPPQSQVTKTTIFSPQASLAVPETPGAGPLKVLRYMPQGEVEQAVALSVTFSQPMVALSSLHELSKVEIPVRLSPQPPGKWRWIDTSTVLFEPDGGQFPKATDYKVAILSEARSLAGNQLGQPVEWEFSTPGLKIIRSYPPQPEPQNSTDTRYFSVFESRQPEIFIELNQQIQPRDLIQTLFIMTSTTQIAVELVDPAGLKLDFVLESFIKQAKPGCWMLFRPVQPLPDNALISISILPGRHSSEGPAPPQPTQTLRFRSIQPLEVYEGINDDSNWSGITNKVIQFSNALDNHSFRPEMVQVEPELEGKTVTLKDRILEVGGKFRRRTTYSITLSPEICDIYGQHLGKSKTMQITTQRASTELWLPAQDLLTLDPYGPPEFPVFTVNVKTFSLQLYQVEPSDWYAYLDLGTNPAAYRGQVIPPGLKKVDRQVVPKNDLDRLVETRIDLREALSGKVGHVLAVIKWSQYPTDPNYEKTHFLWIQITNLAADVTNEFYRLSVWVNRLDTGKPVPKAVVTLLPEGKSAQVDHHGQVRFQASTKKINKAGTILVQKGPDSVIVIDSVNFHVGNQNWGGGQSIPGPYFTWYTVDDRKLYRPGESVHIKGWVRHLLPSAKGNMGQVRPFAKQVKYRVLDAFQTELATGTIHLSRLGGFECQFTLPDSCRLGVGQVVFELVTRYKKEAYDTKQTTHFFEIEEFRRPEYEVQVDVADGQHVIGTQASVQASVHYFTGNTLPNSQVNWTVTAISQPFTPPTWYDYQFGQWQSWHTAEEFNRKYTASETCSGQVDARGQHQLKIDLDAVEPVVPMLVKTEASVTDINRTNISGRAEFLVHPATLYVGIRSQWNFAERGQDYPVELIVTDPDGKLQPDQNIELSLFRLEQFSFEGESEVLDRPIAQAQVVSANHPVVWKAPATESGPYRVRATIRDDHNRMNLSEITFLQLGDLSQFNQFARFIDPERIELTANQSSYQPGETAEIKVESPFAPAEGLLTISNSGVLSSRRFTLNSRSEVLKIPITKSNVPILSIVIDLVGTAPRYEGNQGSVVPPRPAFATKKLELPVKPTDQTLSVAVTPISTEVQPGKETAVDLEIKDAHGKPVRESECALIVVDEAVWSLTKNHISHPLEIFYQYNSPFVFFFHSRQTVALYPFGKLGQSQPPQGSENPAYEAWKLVLWDGLKLRKIDPERWNNYPPPFSPPREASQVSTAPFPQIGSFTPQVVNSPSTPVTLRSNFSPLAAFIGSIITDAQGRARATFKMPDNVTRYHIIALAAAGENQFGKGESTITARLPLMVRPAAPRFVNQGDRFELPVTIHNQSDFDAVVNIVIQSHELAFPQGIGQQIFVPSNDRVELRFPAEANQVGTARVRIATFSTLMTDAAEIEIPVYSPVSSESLCTYGELET